MLNILTSNERGVVFKSTKLPPIFNVYILKGKAFKDGTFTWKLGIENANDINKYFIFDSMRGTINDAIQKMCNVMNDEVCATD